MATGGEVPGRFAETKGSEAVDELKCSPCQEDGKLRDAAGMCLDCQEYLCQPCYDSHTVPRPTRDHRLLDKHDMVNSQVRLDRRDTCTEKCSKHREEIIKYYCSDHSQLSCGVCLNLNHRTCNGVLYIPDVAEDLANNVEYLQVESQLKSSLEKCKKVKEELKRIDDIAEGCVGAKTELEKKQIKMAALKDANQKCQLFIEMMKEKSSLEKLESKITKAQKDVIGSKEDVKLNRQIEALEKMVVTDKSTIVKAEYDREFNVKTDGDYGTCAITGSVVMPNNRLMLADCDNRAVKFVDADLGRPIAELKLSAFPFDIAKISNNQVAVTVPHEKKIVLIHLATPMYSYGSVDVDGFCYGIDFSKGKLAVVHSGQVQVMNLQGAVLHNVKPLTLRDPIYVIFGPDGQTLYISDHNGCAVFCTRFDGTILATYVIEYPNKAIIDSSCNIFICSERTHTIHLLNKRLEKMRELLTKDDGILAPKTICYDERVKELYIGLWNNTYIKVYKTISGPV